MRELTDRWLPARLRFVTVALPEREVRFATATAAAFNSLGMLLELMILRNSSIPWWPEAISSGVGALIFLAILTGRLQGRVNAVKALFVLNAIAVSFALFEIYSFYPFADHDGLLFQATKLGAVVAGLLAPGFLVGLMAIGVHIGSSVIQFSFFLPDFRASGLGDEPWAMFAFGLAGVFVLVHRMRVRQLQVEAQFALTEAESIRRLAHAFLDLRDQMNTPVQSVEIAAALLKKSGTDMEVVKHLQQSCARLREIAESLRRHEDRLEWSASQDGVAVIVSESHAGPKGETT